MAPQGFISLDTGRLSLDGQAFIHVGVNIPGLAYYGTSALPYSAAGDRLLNLATFSQMGARGVRIFGANNQVTVDQAVAAIEDLANKALNSYNMRLIVSLTDLFCNYHQAPGDGAFCTTSPSGMTILSHDWFAGGYRQNYLPWVRALVTRLRNHAGILAWELGNELKDESNPSQLIEFSNEVVHAIKQIDAYHLVSTGSTARAALLGVTDTEAWYGLCDVVQVHAYDGDRSDTDIVLARAMRKGHIVGESGFRAGCGQGGRAGSVQVDSDQWINIIGTDGYYPWAMQAQGNDIGDGDNTFGVDSYCHTDFGQIYNVLAALAASLPGYPGPPPPPPIGTVPLPLVLLGGVGIVLAGYFIGSYLASQGESLRQPLSEIIELPIGSFVPPGYRVVG